MLLSTVQDDCPIHTPGITKDDVLKAAALAAKWKEPPRDALDTLVSAMVEPG
jgi:H+-transporting ATPase